MARGRRLSGNTGYQPEGSGTLRDREMSVTVNSKDVAGLPATSFPRSFPLRSRGSTPPGYNSALTRHFRCRPFKHRRDCLRTGLDHVNLPGPRADEDVKACPSRK